MQDMQKVCFAIVIVLVGFTAAAQTDVRFLPYDCRKNADITFFEPEVSASESLDTAVVVVAEPELIIKIDTIDAWQYWSAVENYSFGKNRGSLPMINDLKALHPFFRDRIIALIAQCKEKGIELAVVETFRTHAKQHEYKTMGKKYTSSSAGKSRHQYGLAVDVVPIVDSAAVWDNSVLWRKIGLVGEKIGLRWGGRWRKPFDPGHFEWTDGLTSSLLSSGILPAVPESDTHYPCLEEDLRLLRKYWEEWETAQSALTRK